MLLPPIVELTLVGVAGRNDPNRERIILRPTEPVNLGAFGLFLGYKTDEGRTIPLADSFYWFGEVEVAPPGWIFVYTGKGEYRETEIPELGQTAYVFHWGRTYTVFLHPRIVPALFRIGGVLVGEPDVDNSMRRQLGSTPKE
jgi:hypothetical protein